MPDVICQAYKIRKWQFDLQFCQFPASANQPLETSTHYVSIIWRGWSYNWKFLFILNTINGVELSKLPFYPELSTESVDFDEMGQKMVRMVKTDHILVKYVIYGFYLKLSLWIHWTTKTFRYLSASRRSSRPVKNK